jgi:hypothetical protein
MSLHDMYFSKKNKNHIFSILQDLILKETGYNINQNEDYIDLYRIKYSLIFERTNVDNLAELNKVLIDEVGNLFINDIQSKYKENKIEIVHEKESTRSLFTINEDKEDKEDKELNEIYINSSERVVDSLNRYNYSIQLKDFINEIIVQEITIPEENNILFSNPLLCLVITSDNKVYQIFCKLKDKLQLEDKIYNTYYPLKKLRIQCKGKIKIEIRTNNNLEIDTTNDKIEIQKIKQIKYQNKDYLGILLKDNYGLRIKDSIGIFCENELIRTFIVNKISKNCLLIENKSFNYEKGKEYSLLNMNLQNNILLNY